MCGKKQSLQRIYATSNRAKDCRDLVQQYNSARGLVEKEEDARVEAKTSALAPAEAAAVGAAPAGDWANKEWWMDSEGEGWEAAAVPAPQTKWSAFQTTGEAEPEGWTVGLPERPAMGSKRGSGAGGAEKRKRKQDGEDGLSRQEDVGLLGWGQEQQQRCSGHGVPKKQQQHERQVGWQCQLLTIQPTNVQLQSPAAAQQQQYAWADWYSETTAVEAAGHLQRATKQHQQQQSAHQSAGGKWCTFVEGEVEW